MSLAATIGLVSVAQTFHTFTYLNVLPKGNHDKYKQNKEHSLKYKKFEELEYKARKKFDNVALQSLSGLENIEK